MITPFPGISMILHILIILCVLGYRFAKSMAALAYRSLSEFGFRRDLSVDLLPTHDE